MTAPVFMSSYSLPRLIDIAQRRTADSVHSLANGDVAIKRLKSHRIVQFGLRRRWLVEHGVRA